MSREIRRVPVDYKHPVTLNSNWEEHLKWRLQEGKGEYRLHEQHERFISMYPYEMYSGLNEDIMNDRESYLNRSGDAWDFRVKYHLTGIRVNDDSDPVIHPFYSEWNSWDDYEDVDVRDEDHLQELLLIQLEDEEESRNPAEAYMPSFEDYDEDELGWCLYQTVSEGTPVTPVFETKEELIEYLVEYGTEDDPPLRRQAAENIVSTGYTVGTMFSVGNKLYDSTQDADKF